ncbi:MAG: hypothetical protein AAGD00_04180 [Planctomycetota bacterium]
MNTEDADLFGQRTPHDEHDRNLLALYEAAERTLDDLPYTPEFERLYADISTDESEGDVLRRLQRLRKAGKLPRLGRRGSTPAIHLTPEEESTLRALVEEKVESLGQRDRLPYTADFDAVLLAFNEQTQRTLDHHTLWRLIARIAK